MRHWGCGRCVWLHWHAREGGRDGPAPSAAHGGIAAAGRAAAGAVVSAAPDPENAARALEVAVAMLAQLSSHAILRAASRRWPHSRRAASRRFEQHCAPATPRAQPAGRPRAKPGFAPGPGWLRAGPRRNSRLLRRSAEAAAAWRRRRARAVARAEGLFALGSGGDVDGGSNGGGVAAGFG